MNYDDKPSYYATLAGTLPGGPWHTRSFRATNEAEVLAGTKVIATCKSATLADAFAELPELLASADTEHLRERFETLNELCEDALECLARHLANKQRKWETEQELDILTERLAKL